MTGYKLATLQTAKGPRAAAVIGNAAYDAAELTGEDRYESVQAILDDWQRAHALLEAASRNPNCAETEIATATFLAPLPLPGAIYCAGANYCDHAEEMAKLSGRPPEDPRANGARPWFFLKSSRSVIGPDAPLRVSGYGDQIDWEAELAVVIGRKARNVSAADALVVVAGYTCGNDLSARDHVFRSALPPGSPFRADWTMHKSFDDACPLGPWIVPASYIDDPADLSIRLWVNGDLKQDSNTGQMIFSIAEQVAFMSESITLHPGDVILTGTPAGVGMSKQEFLRPGDVVRMEIGGIGALQNPVE